MLTATDFARTRGKTFRGSDGVRFTVQSVNMYGNNVVSVRFAVSAPAGRPVNRTGLGLRLTDARGREQETVISNLRLLRQNVRELEAEDLLWWSGSPLGGFPASLPWAALGSNPRKLNRRHWSGFAQLRTQEPIGSATKLTLFRFERLRTEVPFEFRKLPLP